MGNNKDKSEFLGINTGTAFHRLRKQFYFKLIKQFNLNICFRCNEEILTETELSLDHKEPWLYVSKEKFWDLNNLAFSHLKCNVLYVRRTKREECRYNHGKERYKNSYCLECNRLKWHYIEYAKLRQERRKYKINKAEELQKLREIRNTQILELAKSGKSSREISKELGNISHVTVTKIIKKFISP